MRTVVIVLFLVLLGLVSIKMNIFNGEKEHVDISVEQINSSVVEGPKRTLVFPVVISGVNCIVVTGYSDYSGRGISCNWK